jgi:ABC-type multidrug transport system fused ATPase/permease subunit
MIFIGASVAGMGDLYAQLQRTVGASERILEILEEESEFVLEEKLLVNSTEKITQQPAIVAGNIVFKNVQFSYPTRTDVQVLKSINFEILAGQKIALVGHSGAGKSTIAQLLMKFYKLENTNGQISIDNQNINDINTPYLRQNIGIVPQEVILFGGTIKENISYGKLSATDAEIIEAAKQANALDFIEGFPEKFDTVVGERGIKLSGGQRQRIAIARAILKNPRILVLDEATSSLDAESEKLVADALDNLMQNRTTIIIAHRLATIRKVDKIYVLSNGNIMEQGTHDELFAQNEGIYNNLVRLQLEMN